jgi:hypothetical protein
MVNLQNKPGTGTQAFYQADKDTGSGFGNNTGLRRPGVFQGAAELLRHDLKDPEIDENLIRRIGSSYFPDVTGNGYLLHTRIMELLRALTNHDHQFSELKTAPSVLLQVCLRPKMLEVWDNSDTQSIGYKLSFDLAYEAVTILRRPEWKSNSLRNSGSSSSVSAGTVHKVIAAIPEKKIGYDKPKEVRQDTENSVKFELIAIAQGMDGPQSIQRLRNEMDLTKILTVTNTYKFINSSIDVLKKGLPKSASEITSRITKLLKMLKDNSLFAIDCTDSKGATLLMVAASKGNEYLIEALKECGADPTLKDTSGRTAADYAARNGYSRISNLLEEDAQEFRRR